MSKLPCVTRNEQSAYRITRSSFPPSFLFQIVSTPQEPAFPSLFHFVCVVAPRGANGLSFAVVSVKSNADLVDFRSYLGSLTSASDPLVSRKIPC
jgi:hypothetical protein